MPPNCKERAKIIASGLGDSLREDRRSKGTDLKELLAENRAVQFRRMSIKAVLVNEVLGREELFRILKHV